MNAFSLRHMSAGRKSSCSMQADNVLASSRYGNVRELDAASGVEASFESLDEANEVPAVRRARRDLSIKYKNLQRLAVLSSHQPTAGKLLLYLSACVKVISSLYWCLAHRRIARLDCLVGVATT